MLNVKTFLNLVLQIQSEAPRYKLGGFGLNGICDCIGLIKGALIRGGAGWGKTHGSNYVLRYEMRITFVIKRLQTSSLVWQSISITIWGMPGITSPRPTLTIPTSGITTMWALC